MKRPEISSQTQTQNKYQPKPEYNKIIIDRSNHNMRSNSNQQIYSSRTSKETPKLKYYVKCPNCGYHLNDESAVNKFNRGTDANNSVIANRRESYNTYENKTYMRTAVKDKDKDKGIAAEKSNTNNYMRHTDYNQRSNVYNSVKNLQKVKDFTHPIAINHESHAIYKKSK